MDTPAHMYYPQMLLLLLLMGVCTIWLARMLQWIILRKTIRRKRILFILLLSTLISYLLALLFWCYWPQHIYPMWGIFFLPAIAAETMILCFTFAFLKKRKQL